VTREITVKTFQQQLEDDLKSLLGHLFRAVWQNAQLTECKKHLQTDKTTMITDYSENYRCNFQYEVQNAVFEPAQVTNYPMTSYYKKVIQGDVLVKHAVIGVGNHNKHDPHGSSCSRKKP